MPNLLDFASTATGSSRDDAVGRAATGRSGRTPRVLVVHNRYQIRGGEDVVVDREVAALRRAGIAVETVFLDNAAIRGPVDRARAFLETAHAPRGIAQVLGAVARVRPDVVHVHNVMPLISPGVHRAVRAAGAATVQTLHNFRVACANGILMREGGPCEDCLTGSPYQAVLHRCYRGSIPGSFAVARMIDRHRRAGTWLHDVDRFIALTRFARSRFLAAGLPEERIAVKPNGLPDPGRPVARARRGVVFAGRLSAEKGVGVLAQAAALGTVPVTVIGEGPMAEALAGAPGLALVGRQGASAVRAAMERASAVVVPSLCYEGQPTVLVEAFAAGTPVIGSRLGGLAELIEDGATGLLVPPGDPRALAAAIARLAADPAEGRRMGAAGRAVFERTWTEAVTTAALVDLYREAVAARAADPLAPHPIARRSVA